LGGAARPGDGESTGDRVKLHRHLVRLDGRQYTVITPRPGTGVRFSTNFYHGTWHVLCGLRGARLLAHLLWGLAYQRVPGTVVVIGAPLLDPNPFDAEPADPVAVVPAMLTSLGTQAARQLRQRLPLGRPAGTVRWHTPGLAPAVAAWRHERGRPPGQRPWYPLPDSRHRIDRAGGMLVLTTAAPELKSWAVCVAQLGDWLCHGMDYTDLNGTDGEVQVFTDYQHRVSAARAARREILAGPASLLPRQTSGRSSGSGALRSSPGDGRPQARNLRRLQHRSDRSARLTWPSRKPLRPDGAAVVLRRRILGRLELVPLVGGEAVLPGDRVPEGGECPLAGGRPALWDV
jgi:hypothetical protein